MRRYLLMVLGLAVCWIPYCLAAGTPCHCRAGGGLWIPGYAVEYQWQTP
jgi:hypothetical protein